MEDDQERILTRYLLWKKFIQLRQEGYPAKATETKRKAGGGFEIRELHTLPLASCGRVISGEPAGMCQVCQNFECSSEHLFLCASCHKSVCIVCANPLETSMGFLAFCQPCCKFMLLNQNSWNLKRIEDVEW